MTAPRIRILAPELADQIAAGEVVERPAAVVKELVENALDAGAHRIEVEVEGGGLEQIRVTDDGEGMTPDEAHLALRRHATSKLSAIDDLFALTTMGFRGEALPSIAAVSDLLLTTRRAETADGIAYRLAVSGGVAGEAREVGAPVGTQVEVRRLFSNVPARLKFMKSEATETGHIVDGLTRLALSFGRVHLRLRSSGRVLLDLPPHSDGLERARAVLGRTHKRPPELHIARGESTAARIEAYLGSPAHSATTSRGTYPLVNQRFVRDRGLLSAVAMGYGELLERGRYPLAVVHVVVPGPAVDINVHPQKIEVRFADPREVYRTVRRTLAEAVARAPWLSEPAGSPLKVYSLPPASGSGEGSGGGAREPSRGYEEHRRRAAEALHLFAPGAQLPGLAPAPLLARIGASDPPQSAAAEATSTSSADRFFSQLRYLGQLDRTYLVCEGAGELVLIDQHAAHERVAFGRLREAYGRREVRAQRLLLPASIQLDEGLVAVAASQGELLSSLGFELEPFGERTVLLRALPAALSDAPPAEILSEILGELAAHEGTEVVAQRLDHLLATMACHSVVRAGDLLGEPQVRALLESMDGVDYRAHCPHGRPVLLRLSLGELEKRFGRT